MRIEKDSNDIYHSHNSISASGLKFINKKSVYHFINRKQKETASMAFGTAVHTAILEKDTFDDIYEIAYEKFDLRTKIGKQKKQEFEEKAEGKIVISSQDYDRIKDIVRNYKKNTFAQKYCRGEVELSHYLEHDGVPVRVRPDVINHVGGFITDVKTCQDASPKGFRSAIYQHNYHLQAAFYMDMLGVDVFKFVACEVNHPHCVVVHTLDEELIELGRQEYKKSLEDWKHYLDTGEARLYQPETRISTYAEDGTFLIKK